MPILGIDYDKCINCDICLSACTDPELYIKKNQKQDKIIFEDPNNWCNKCGQCIAQCPEDAIIYEGMGESFTFEELNSLDSLISYETLFKFLAANRSVRKYKKEKVPEDVLKKVIQAMYYASTAANMKSENFYVISDPEKIKALSDAIFEEHVKEPSEKEHWIDKKERYNKTNRDPVYYNAPHLIVVTSNFNMLMEGFNIGNIITYGRLAAQALGLGTCWNGYTTLAIQKNPKIRKIADIRGNVVAAFTIGYPAVNFHRVSPRSPNKTKGLT